jgi:hypothetical protein
MEFLSTSIGREKVAELREKLNYQNKHVLTRKIASVKELNCWAQLHYSLCHST